MKISVLAAWNTPDEQKEFIDEIHGKWGPEISVEFFDGSDFDSRWTFEGPAEKVKEIICEYFQVCPEPMDFDELIRLVEVDAIVDGKNMAEDLAINRIPKKKQMKKVFAVHVKIAPAGEFDRFDVELFADEAAANARCAEIEEQLNEEYADDIEDDPSCVEVYVLELPVK